MDLEGQTLLNRYHVRELIGRGGMAEVYRVWDSQRMSFLAAKMLHKEMALDRVFLERFQREAKVLEVLQHQNIVRYYGIEQFGHSTFMLLEFVDGITLKERIFDAAGQIPWGEIKTVMRDVCSALNFAHRQGFVHCDLKPTNIMLSRDGRTLLSDFGIVRLVDASTMTLVGAGTPPYMAPEQILGKDPSPETDIYSLAIVLYEMLTGQRPFKGESSGITGTVGERVRWEHLNMDPVPPTYYNPNIPKPLEDIVLRCLSKEPGNRPKSVMDIYDVLLQTASNEFTAPQISTGGEASSDSQLLTPSRAPKTVLGITLVAVLALVLTISAGILLGGSPGAAEPTQLMLITQSEPSNQSTRLPSLTRTNGSTDPIQALLSSANPSGTPTFTPTPKISSPTPVNTATPNPTNTPSSDWHQGHIVFMAKNNSGSALYVIDLQKPNDLLLLDHSSAALSFLGSAISPSGDQVAYYDYKNAILFTRFTQPNANPIRLGSCQHPSWSYGGDQLLCRSEGSHFSIIDSATGSVIETLPGEIRGTLPSWSPNGSEIAYASFEGNNTDIWSASILTDNLLLLAGDASENYAPSWSPDGNFIAYQSNQDSSASEIWIMDRFGGNKQRLTHTPNGNWSRAPSWSPDGLWLAYVSNQNGSIGADYGEIFIISITTGNIAQLTNTGGLVYDWRVSWGR